MYKIESLYEITVYLNIDMFVLLFFGVNVNLTFADAAADLYVLRLHPFGFGFVRCNVFLVQSSTKY